MNRRKFLTYGVKLLAASATIEMGIYSKLFSQENGFQSIINKSKCLVWFDGDPSLSKYGVKGKNTEIDDWLNWLIFANNRKFFETIGLEVAGFSVGFGNNNDVDKAFQAAVEVFEDTNHSDLTDLLVKGASRPKDKGAKKVGEIISRIAIDNPNSLYLLGQGGASNISNISDEAAKSIKASAVMWGHTKYRQNLISPCQFNGKGFVLGLLERLNLMYLEFFNLNMDIEGAFNYLKKVGLKTYNWTSNIAIPLFPSDVKLIEDEYIKSAISARSKSQEYLMTKAGSGIFIWDAYFCQKLLDWILPSYVNNYTPIYSSVMDSITVDCTDICGGDSQWDVCGFCAGGTSIIPWVNGSSSVYMDDCGGCYGSQPNINDVLKANYCGCGAQLKSDLNGVKINLDTSVDVEMYKKTLIYGLNGKLHELYKLSF